MKYSVFSFKMNTDCVLVGEGNGKREFLRFERVSEMVNHINGHGIDVPIERCYLTYDEWKAASKAA